MPLGDLFQNVSQLLIDRKGGKRGTFEKKNKFTATTLATVIQETLKIGQKYSTVLQARERVSERASERMSAAERARPNQAVRSIAIE